jgi:alkylation response protein AidB-like acyl-CoA dehydrogenase
MPAAITTEALLEAVARIEPVLREHAAEAEAKRRLSDAAAAAMKGAGLFRMWVPRAYGGLEVDPLTALPIFEEVARIDSAAGWNLALPAANSLFLAFLDEQAAAEVFGEPDSIIAGTFFPPCNAVPVDGGFRVTGRMPFASACHHCGWFIVLAHVVENGTERTGADGAPETWFIALRASDFEIIDHWNTVGMRGTGSHDAAIRDAFVPRHRAAPLAASASRQSVPKGFEGPLYRCTVWPAHGALASIALGIARAALDELVTLARTKTPAYMPSPLSQRSLAQSQVAQAEARLGAARAYLYEALREVWENAVAGHFVALPQKLKVQLAAVHAALAAAEAVDLVQAAAGTSGIRCEYGFERHFRDVHSITQHAYISASRYESVGKLLFGLESDWGFLEY